MTLHTQAKLVSFIKLDRDDYIALAVSPPSAPLPDILPCLDLQEEDSMNSLLERLGLLPDSPVGRIHSAALSCPLSILAAVRECNINTANKLVGQLL